MKQTKLISLPKSTDIVLAEHLGKFLDGANTLVGIKDIEHRYLYANKELELLYGAPSGGMFGVKSEAIVRNEDIAAEIYARENYVTHVGKSAHFIERVHINGELHVWQTIRFPFLDPNRIIIGTGFIAIDTGDGLDLTDEQQETLEHARKKTIHLNAHDNNPGRMLAGMANHVELDRADNGIPGQINLNWSKIYESSNPTIDQQHRVLCEQAYQLQKATLNGKQKTEILRLIESLLHQITQHFRDEESILRKALFPYTDEHSKLHATIIASATALAEQYRKDKFNQSDLISFLVYDVLLWHMLEDDRKFFAYLDPGFPLTPDT